MAGTDRKDLMRKLPKFIYDEEKALEVSFALFIISYLHFDVEKQPTLLGAFKKLLQGALLNSDFVLGCYPISQVISCSIEVLV